jgi:hypothetical protein
VAIYSCHSYYYWRCEAFCANRQSGGTLAAPIGEAGQIRSANMKFSQIFYVRCALPISGVQIAEQIVLAEHKENERIGKVWITMRSALPIVIEIA